jgi:septal ring factor EnvC (AmiA/AmiB activator)
MRFSDLKDNHQRNAMRTTQVQGDFLAHWLDANGVNFADGVLGGLMEKINKLSEDAAAAAVQQQNNELYRSEIVQYINAAKMRDEAQDAKNKELSAECDALEQEIAALDAQRSQLDSSASNVSQLISDLQRI